MLDLTLPAGEPGSLVCEQSVLVDERDSPGRIPPTSPACFKLRASDPPAPVKSGGRTSADAPAPARGPAGPSAPDSGSAAPGPAGPAAPAGPPASATRTAAGSRSGRSAASEPAPTPPGRAAVEAVAAVRGTPTARTTAPAAPVRTAATGAAAAPAVSPVAPDAAGAPAAALARTGLENQIPLAGAGLLLALGGAAIIFGEPRRRTWGTRPA
jgi:hypothetical protein